MAFVRDDGLHTILRLRNGPPRSEMLTQAACPHRNSFRGNGLAAFIATYLLLLLSWL